MNRPTYMPCQIPFITRIARLPARQVQQVAQPIPNVFRQPACEPIAPASCKVRGVVDKIQPRRVGVIEGVVPAIPIEVRVAQVGIYRVSLQPAGGAGVVGAGALMGRACKRVSFLQEVRNDAGVSVADRVATR